MGAWYRAGTVAVTNGDVHVTGTNTLWTTQASQGDIFSLDGDKFYEIASITDDTHLVLQAAFLGTTGSALSYEIIRNFTSTTNAQLASNLAGMLDQWHQYLDDMLGWLGGTGTVTVHDANNTAYQVKTPAQLNAETDGVLSLSVAGGTDITLTDTQFGHRQFVLTGALTANINVIAPAGEPRVINVWNQTTGAFTLTFKTAASGSTGVTIAQGARADILIDGTNAYVQNTTVAINTGTINATPIGATTPSTGKFTSLISTGVQTFWNTRKENLSLSVAENTTYQQFKITAGTTRINALVTVEFSAKNTGGVPQGAGFGVFNLRREDGGVTLETLQISNPSAGVAMPLPEVSGNDVIFSFAGFNNGTGTTFTVDTNITTQSSTLSSFTTTNLSSTTTSANTAIRGATIFETVAATGIKFNGGTTALSAYEEGTFTPTIGGGTTAGNNTYSQQKGSYTRIGRTVHFKAAVTLATLDAAMAGPVRLYGLPYTSANDGGHTATVFVPISGINLQTGYSQATAYQVTGTSFVALDKFGASGDGNIQPTDLTGTAQLFVSGTYNI